MKVEKIQNDIVIYLDKCYVTLPINAAIIFQKQLENINLCSELRIDIDSELYSTSPVYDTRNPVSIIIIRSKPNINNISFLVSSVTTIFYRLTDDDINDLIYKLHDAITN